MAYRKNNRGDYRIKRSFRMVGGIEVGKFDKPSGTKDAELAAEIERSLERLSLLGVEGARLLCDIRDGVRSALEVHILCERQQALNVDTIRNAELFWDTWQKFVWSAKRKDGITPLSRRTKSDYLGYGRLLANKNANATVGELPRILREWGESLNLAADSPKEGGQQFRKMKFAALSFARSIDADKKFSPLWQAIAKVAVPEQSRGRTKSALRFYKLRRIIEKLPTQEMRDIALTCALTGMSPKDYAGRWEVKTDRVHILGTKNRYRVREVPLIATVTPHAFSYYYPGVGMMRNSFLGKPVRYEDFNDALRAASNGSVTPNVLRHCYKLLLRNANIDTLRQRAYMGWKEKSLEEVYGSAEWSAFIRHDGKLLKEFLAREWNASDPLLEDYVPLNLADLDNQEVA